MTFFQCNNEHILIVTIIGSDTSDLRGGNLEKIEKT